MTTNSGSQPPGGNYDPNAIGNAPMKADRPWYKKKRWIAAIVLGIFVIAGAGGAGGGAAEDAVSNASDESSSVDSGESTESTESSESTDSTESDDAPDANGDGAVEDAVEEPEPEPDLTSGQENAVRSAEQYLATAAFSRSGLIEQLEFEGYERDDASFAVDYLDINFRQQAVASAEQYLDLSGFSESGLIEQLEFEGYTTGQATFGARQALG